MDLLQGKQESSDQDGVATLAPGESFGVRRLHTLSELVDLLQIPRRRFRAWLQAGLITPAEIEHGIPFFDFRQVACAKTLFELTKAGISTAKMRRSLERLEQWRQGLAHPLEQLALLQKNGQVMLRIEEGLVEPSGQMLLDFGEDATIVTVQTTSAEAWFLQGIQNEEDGLLNEAADAYRQALLVGGPDSDVAFNLANVLYAQGSKEEAGERYRQVVEMAPSYAEAWNTLGVILVELRGLEAAVTAFKRAVGLGYTDAHFNLAGVLENLGDIDAAKEHWIACVRLDPSSEHVRYARRKLA